MGGGGRGGGSSPSYSLKKPEPEIYVQLIKEHLAFQI